MSTMSIWLIVAFFCIAGIIIALLQINRVMDFSSTFFGRWRKDDRGDEGGIFTTLTHDEKAALSAERHRLGRTSIPEAGLRADLPPGTTSEVQEQIEHHQKPGVPPSSDTPRPGLRTEAGEEKALPLTDGTRDERYSRS